MKANRIWVVEMWIGNKWLPSSACGITREDARNDLHDWRDKNPADKFRIRPYYAKEQP